MGDTFVRNGQGGVLARVRRRERSVGCAGHFSLLSQLFTSGVEEWRGSLKFSTRWTSHAKLLPLNFFVFSVRHENCFVLGQRWTHGNLRPTSWQSSVVAGAVSTTEEGL